MDAGRYLMKAEMQLKRGLRNEAVDSLERAIVSAQEAGDWPGLISAHCFLGEVRFMQGDYEKATEHLSFVQNHREKAKAHDDLLNDEIQESALLLSLIERYSWMSPS
ncbi:MAG: tetratricopeptide repeat protein [Candidatus Accumulibacter sp.]|jgi:tetratricopeptide (TPR) repeat protein|nr:tetratricopeptide repeat protein [Accumulibacter sp.]